MTFIPTAHTFLESLAGYSQVVAKAENPSANAPIRIAVVDPSYVATSYPATLPKVTFEGEETMTDKRYIVVGGYQPQPSDRVVMLPIGHTYGILGSINAGAPVVTPRGLLDYSEILADTAGTTATAADVGVSVTAVCDSDRKYRITGSWGGVSSSVSGDDAGVFITDNSNNQLQTSGRLDCSGTSTTWYGGTIIKVYNGGLAGSQTFKLRYGRIAGTGTVILRAASTNPSSISIEEIG